MDEEVTLNYYNPEIFHDIDSVERAKWVILNDDNGHTTDERWATETPWIIKEIAAWMPTREGTTALDYGMGIGRIAKPLIDELGWRVMGVDISAAMMSMALDYVGRDRFFVCTPEMLDTLLPFGVTFDFAVAVWVLQHCWKPEEDIARIKRAVKVGGRIFVVNMVGRSVPIKNAEWVKDGIDIWAMLMSAFVPLKGGRIPEDLVGDGPAFWGVFERVND